MSESPKSLFDVLVEEYEHQRASRERSETPLEALYSPEELAALQRQPRDPAASDEDENPTVAALIADFYRRLHEKGVKRAALCFSGGGIRSATFNLGVLQGLARHFDLTQFHFLSTVSGGGYIGSWFSAWVHRRGIKEVEAALAGADAMNPLEPEAMPIRHLRSYSRYMSPQLGLLSADTWTLVAIFSRNLLLNWFVLVPLLLVVLMLPRLLMSFACWDLVLDTNWRQTIATVIFWAGALWGIWAIAYVIASRPSFGGRPLLFNRLALRGGDPGFVLHGLIPLAIISLTSAFYWVWIHRADGSADPIFGFFDSATALLFICFGMALHFAGFLVSRLFNVPFRVRDFLYALVTGGLSGSLLWLITRALPHTTKLLPTATPEQILPFIKGIALYVWLAPPLFMLLVLFAATLFVGLASFYTNDEDREWLARAGAWLMIAIAVWIVGCGLVIFGPLALDWLWGKIVGAILTVGTGAITLLGGRSAKTAATKKKEGPEEEPSLSNKVIDMVMPLAAPLFAASILILLSVATSWLIKITVQRGLYQWLGSQLAQYLSVSFDTANAATLAANLNGASLSEWHLRVLYYTPSAWILCFTLIILMIGLLWGFFVNINKFSLHGAYRDRLIRAYLGASNIKRQPNPFTGLADNDNLEMQLLRSSRVPSPAPGPMHIINIALNLVGGKDLAWQDRKAETFTVSPLHVGSLRLGYRRAETYARLPQRKDATAISLGTALAISGAAASPNMGYHSSSIVTFLLALFNVRLGWWLGNPGPAGDKTYTNPGPAFAPGPLITETLGLTNDQRRYVYLSDGGHFENLGLYEMVLRRCHYIVVCDAGCDPDFSFEDLGNAISKIRTDLGIPIELDSIPISPRSPKPPTYDIDREKTRYQKYCAVGRIRYSCVDGNKMEDDGYLLYIKPAFYGTESADIYNYAVAHPTFPHEPTGDQLYSETQFESYRRLGSHVMEQLLENQAKNQLKTWQELEKAVESYLEQGTKPAANAGETPATEGEKERRREGETKR